MKRLLILGILLLNLMGLKLQAADTTTDYIYINNVVMANPGEVTISIKMKNPTAAVSGYQFAINLPSGVTKAADAVSSKSGFTIKTKTVSGGIGIMAYSSSTSSVSTIAKSSDTEIATIKLNVSTTGTKTLTVRDVVLSAPNGNEYHYSGTDKTSTITTHNLSLVSAKAATCTTAGNTQYWKCSHCTTLFSNASATATTTQAAVTIAKKGHGNTNGYTPTFTWGGSATAPTCTFSLKCKDCNSNVVSSVSLTTTSGTNGQIAQKSHTDPTCTAQGSTVYTATGKYSVTGDQTYNGTNDKTYTISATGHSLTATAAKAATCTAAGNNAYWTCSKCNKVYSDENGTTETTVEAQTLPATGHSYSTTPTWTWTGYSSATASFSCEHNDDTQTVTAVVTSAVKTAATCTEKGTTTYTAKVTFEGNEYSDTKDVQDIAATGHSFDSEPVWTWASDYTWASATVKCSIDDSHQLTVKDEEIDVVDNNDGTFTYSATVVIEGNEQSDTKTVRLFDACDINRDGKISVIDITSWVNTQNSNVTIEDIVAKILEVTPVIMDTHKKVRMIGSLRVE